MNTETVITVNSLYKQYKTSKFRKTPALVNAVNGVDFSVHKGEIFGILGPNGAGKTTTLEILEGLKQQDKGQVKIFGLDNLTATEQIKRRIGVQLQSSQYLNYLTLKEIMELFGSMYGVRPDSEMLLGFVDLIDKKNERVKSLSGGQQQRFTLATSLINDPEILFLDEPTTGLDPRARRDVWGLIRKIHARGATVVMTTHYMEEAEFLCDRVAIMSSGQILAIDEPSALIRKFSDTTQVSFLVEQPLPVGFWPAQSGIMQTPSQYPKVILEIDNLNKLALIINALHSGNINFSGFAVKTASLEDVYLRLTGKVFI